MKINRLCLIFLNMMGEYMENVENLEQKQGKFEELIAEVSDTDVTVYDQLNASNDKAAQAEFVNNPDMERPNNEYGKLNIQKVSENMATLAEVEKEMDNSWLTDKEGRLLNYLIGENRTKNEFLFANYMYNHAETPEDKAIAEKWHRTKNVELYGKPDETVFWGIIQEKLASIHPETPEEEEDFRRLKEMIGDVPETAVERFKPKDETVARFSEIVNDFFKDFLKHIPEGKDEFTSEETADIVSEILEQEFDGETGYKAYADPKAANASADHNERVIKFPTGKTYPVERVKSLVCHELGTHVLRAMTYMDNQVESFSKNFPQSEAFEEGVAKCVEQAIKGRYEDSGIDHYINIGLANIRGKDFREIYDIQMLMKKLTHTKPDTVINAVQRCFRGTGVLPNNKDLVYYNGADQAWRYIEEHIDDPELMDTLFLTGKTDILNADQEQLVYEAKVGSF